MISYSASPDDAEPAVPFALCSLTHHLILGIHRLTPSFAANLNGKKFMTDHDLLYIPSDRVLDQFTSTTPAAIISRAKPDTYFAFNDVQLPVGDRRE